MFAQHVVGHNESVCIPMFSLGSEAPLPRVWVYPEDALVFDSQKAVALFMHSPEIFPFSEFMRNNALRRVSWWSRFLLGK
jgi:hypothetical protein